MNRGASCLAAAMDVLNDREKDILVQRRLKDEVVTLEELSGRYDVSRERIRQIEVRAFEKLQKRMQELARQKGMLANGMIPTGRGEACARRGRPSGALNGNVRCLAPPRSGNRAAGVPGVSDSTPVSDGRVPRGPCQGGCASVCCAAWEEFADDRYDPMGCPWGGEFRAGGGSIWLPRSMARGGRNFLRWPPRLRRGPRRFRAFAPGLRVHGTYEALLADPEIDAIYVAACRTTCIANGR